LELGQELELQLLRNSRHLGSANFIEHDLVHGASDGVSAS